MGRVCIQMGCEEVSRYFHYFSFWEFFVGVDIRTLDLGFYVYRVPRASRGTISSIRC